MFERARVRMAVSRIAAQPASEYYFEDSNQRRVFSAHVTDMIMAKYRGETHATLRAMSRDLPARLSVRQFAVLLATNILILLERELLNRRETWLIAYIGILKDCLREYGDLYGEQLMVAECLSQYEKARLALGT
jgi:hypothetical protein